MFGIKYFKADPTTFVQLIKNGKVVKEGNGLSFFYYAPSASIIKVPTSSIELPFFFQVDTADFQELSVQGQLSFQIADIAQATSAINFAVDADAEYKTQEPDTISERVVRAVQVVVKSEVETKGLRALLRNSKTLTSNIQDALFTNASLKSLGISLKDIAITNLAPSAATAKALEAEVRESLLKEADNAIYERRLASLAQDKSVKETELETEKALQRKQQEIESAVIEAERQQMQQRFQLKQEEIAAKIADEERSAELVGLEVLNQKERAAANAEAIKMELTAYNEMDESRLRTLMMAKLGPAQVIANAFEDLAKSDSKIGNLNISPDLLQSLMQETDMSARR